MFTLITQAITNPAIPATFGAAAPNVALTSIIVTIWRTAITLGGLALLVMLISGALEWITAGGEKGKIQAARDRMTQSVIGMLVLVGTVAISLFISSVLGIQLLNPNFADNLSGTVTAPQTGGTNPVCTLGATGSDGGAGGYCTGGGAAQMKCVTTANITYAHWEPCSCLSGTKAWTWTACK